MKRVEQLQAEIESVRQIKGLISALRAIAAGQRREAEDHLSAVRGHAATVGRALGDVLKVVAPSSQPTAPGAKGRSLAIVVGAAHGFSGDFADHIADVARAGDADEFMVVGRRTLDGFHDGSNSDEAVIWSADMATRVIDVPDLASHLVDAVLERVAHARYSLVEIMFVDVGVEAGLVRRKLFPFDFGRFRATDGAPPMMSGDFGNLLAALSGEYVFTEICEALVLGVAAEHEARATAMSRAQSNVRRIEDARVRAYRQARQLAATTEIIELNSK